MKTHIASIVSFCTAGILSLHKNLPLSVCETNDRSEGNLQLGLRPGALNGGTVPLLVRELFQNQ